MPPKILAPTHAQMTYKRGLARVRPFPYHAVIDDVGVILGATSKKGVPGVQAQKPEDQAQVAPNDFGENSTNPVFGRTQTWRTFHLGMGLSVEDADPSKPEGRYRWAINADASVASRLAMQGPEMNHVIPALADTTGAGVNKFFDLKGKVYWLNGRYLQRLDDDDENATVVGDFGVGNRAVDVCVFASNGTGLVFAYITVLDAAGVDTRLWRFDGLAAPVQSAASAGEPTDLKARNVVAIGRNFYRANRMNQISVVDVDTDPWVFGNWGPENQYIIGDKSCPIVALIENATGVLVVLKTDGIYSIDGNGEAIRYFPFLKYGRSEDNGVTWGAFMNDIYVRYGESLYRVTPDFNIQEVGPNRYGTVDGPVKGRTTAFAGHGNFHGYSGMWDSDTNTCFLMKYGSHQPDEFGQPQRIEAWHGSITYPRTDRITQLYVSSFNAPQFHTRMYVGYQSGRIAYFVLPCVPDAASCQHYRFSKEPSWIVMPNWHGGFPSEQKPLRYAAISGDNLSSQEYATLDYRLNPVSADATFGMPWVGLAGNFDTTPTERIEFPDQTQAYVAAFRIQLHGSDPTTSPLITGFSLRWRLVSDFVQIYSFIVLAEDGLICRDGTPLRRGAKSIRDHVRAIITDGRIVKLILPDEDIKLVSIIGYGEAIGWYERKERWASGLKLQVAEDSTGGTYGTYQRLLNRKYGDLVGLKYGDLLSM